MPSNQEANVARGIPEVYPRPVHTYLRVRLLAGIVDGPIAGVDDPGTSSRLTRNGDAIASPVSSAFSVFRMHAHRCAASFSCTSVVHVVVADAGMVGIWERAADVEAGGRLF